MPMITVIVPVYKTEKYLERCVKSILSQTYGNFELILVDDGSPDNCPAMCDLWKEKDKRIKVFHKENSGQAGARNLALDWMNENSTSEWVCFVDSDDYVHPKMLENLLRAAESTQTKISVCELSATHGEPMDDDVESYDVHVVTPEFFFCHDYNHANGPCCKLFRRECFLNIRFPEGKIYEDAFILYKILFSCDKIALLNWVGYAYYENPDSTTRRAWSFRNLDQLQMIDEQIDFFTKRKILNLRRFLIRKLMNAVMWQLVMIEKLPNGELRRKGKRILEKKGRKILISYKKDKVFDREADGHLYMRFFPWSSRIYYSLASMLRKLLRQ